MRALSHCLLTLMLSLCCSLAVNAGTIAYWNFEDGVDGQEFTPAGEPLGSGGSDDLITGTRMRGYSEAAGPTWTSSTPNGLGLAVEFVPNSDAYLFEGPLMNWAPEQWTIELAVQLDNILSWRTLIGRDGNTSPVPESDFYLQNNGIDDRWRLNIATAGGARRILDAAPTGGVQPDTWYALAVVSDGSTITMWSDDGAGYQQIGTLDITDQTPAQNAFPVSNLTWTFGRGWFNGGQGDFVDGRIDNVRFSDMALTPDQFLGLAPEPASAGLMLMALFGAAAIRRK